MTGLRHVLRLRLQRLGGARRIGHRLRCQDDQQAIAVLVGSRDRQRLRVALRAGVAEHVDGVVVAPVRRQQPIERVAGRVGTARPARRGCR